MVERNPSRIDQCLFGYADGHRLLATSLRLGGEVASDLTAISDIAPGVRFEGSNGYWTGLPIPTLSRYGLMRTWPAPEMPRPGCVWTHLLLIDPSLFETVDDLSSFKTLARRPTSHDLDGYAQPLDFTATVEHGPLEGASGHERKQVAEMLGVLYGGLEGPVEISRPGELDGLIMEVWSQQWPRLRRNFRFQTAATTGIEGVSKRFDLQLRIAAPPLREFVAHPDKDSTWLECASNDLRSSSDHSLRKFLRRYGQDVKRQRASFRPLTEVFAVSMSPGGIAGKVLPASIVKWFPDLDDAATLKRDLINGMILSDSQVEAVMYLCESDKGRSLPAPSEAGLRALAGHWDTHSLDLLRLAEWAAVEQGYLADGLLSTVAGIVPHGEFWSATSDFPEMRRRMIANQPDLLDAEAVGEIEPETLIALIDAVPQGRDVGEILVRRLRVPVDRRLVDETLRRFPVTAVLGTIGKADELGPQAISDWLRGFPGIVSTVLDPSLIVKLARLSTLVAVAETLHWLSGDVVKHGLVPWIAALEGAQDDLTQTDRERLDAFLFALAVSVGGDEAERVFERTFGFLHDRMIDAYLTYPAQKILRPILPSAGLFREWDDALKLRLAVTETYVRFNLSTSSFARLLIDRKGRKLLRKAAEEVHGADKYADALRE